MKFLGQNCACCDQLLPPDTNKGKDDMAAGRGSTSTSKQAGPRSPGVDTVFVESQTKVSKSGGGAGGKLEKQGKDLSEPSGSQTVERHTTTTTTVTSSGGAVTDDDVTQRLSPLALDNFPGFPLPSPSAGSRRSRRRRQLVSTTDMLLAQDPQPEVDVTKRLSPFDVMQGHLTDGMGTMDNDVTQPDDCDVTQAEVLIRAPLADISEDLDEGVSES